MKKFDLEAALKGAAIHTRDGRDVRIVNYTLNNPRPILAIITQPNGYEFAVQYYIDGSICKRQDLRRKDHEAEIVTEVRGEDLMMEGDDEVV